MKVHIGGRIKREDAKPKPGKISKTEDAAKGVTSGGSSHSKRVRGGNPATMKRVAANVKRLRDEMKKRSSK